MTLTRLILSFILASGVAPIATAQTPAAAPSVLAQTVSTDSSGNTHVTSQSAEPGAATMWFVQPGGAVTAKTWHATARVLIQIHARPVLDRKSPGSAAETARQVGQLASDLSALDVRLRTQTPSKITRQFHTLFSGVAATVDSSAIGEIRQLPNVDAVYEDAEVHASVEPNITLIGAPTVWSTYGISGAGVKVAVIDTGIDYTHPDLGGCLGVACKVIGGYDFVNSDNDPRDDNGHGTHVAGIIAANGVLKGVAPGATLLAYKVLDSSGSGFTSTIIAGIEQALADGAKVANLSLGGSGDPGDPTSQAIDNATAAGMLSVVAAGNSGSSYLTIDSPGTARTALTVGAADNNWVMAYFSSRGYVVAGSDYLMKPEVVAPGVNILSTVPATGQFGSPTGYAVLSGTSMATPHVAGSAALLLEWNAALSPQDIKNRLARAGRTLGQDPFTQGAGGIDLVSAFGLPMLVSATNVSFGVISATSGTVTTDQTVSIQNLGPSQTFTLVPDPTLPAGTTLQLIPPSVTLQQGGSTNVTLRLTVNAAVTPEPPDPMDWSTRVAISNGTQTAHLPAYFFKGSVLSLSFDEPPWYVTLAGSGGVLRTYYNPAGSLSLLVKSGMWDVVTGYLPPPPFVMVVKEQQNVQGNLALGFTRAQATHAVSALPVDDTGQPLRTFDYYRDLEIGYPDSGTSGLPSGLGGTMGVGDFLVSDVSSRYLLTFIRTGSDPSGLQFFGSGLAAKGLSSDVTLPIAGVPYRVLGQTATPSPGARSSTLFYELGWALKMSWGSIADVSGAARTGELSKTLHIQFTVPPGLAVLPLQRSELFDNDNTVNIFHDIEGPYFDYKDPANIGIDTSPFFDLLDSSRLPETVLGANVTRWDLDTPPESLPMVFQNTPTTIAAGYNLFSASWMSQTLGLTNRVSDTSTSFDLYRNGVVTGTYPLYGLQPGIPSAAGAQEVHASFAYAIGVVAGSTQVVASFDTSKTDRNPPTVSRFRIEQNGMRTPTPDYPSKNAITVKFRATDDFTLSSVVLESRQSGATIWSPLSLSGTLPDYQATIHQGGSIDLRITATDASGNSFQEQWTPALITFAPIPPSVPTSVSATRSGTSAVTVSWAPSTSNVGIAGYRIDRAPGNQSFTTLGTGTNFIDSNGLSAGSAYFYRVSAIDTEDEVSTPSVYDVATLFDFTDDPVTAGFTPIRGVHVADLRRAIDAVRQAAGLARIWTDYSPPTGMITSSIFLDLRDHLNEARAAMSVPAVQLSDAVATGALMRARSVKELRDGVK